MDKFKMDLTWHNCKTHPPKEDRNDFLIVTDGDDIYAATWHKLYGYNIKYDISRSSPFELEQLDYWWWADIVQTIHKSLKFMEV